MKKIISILLALSVILTAVTVLAATEGDYEYTVSSQNATITGYSGKGGAVTIPSMLGGHTVVGIGVGAFYGCKKLTSVTIPESVKTIQSVAFYGCTALTSVTIPDSVINIEESAFYNTGYYNNRLNWENGNVLYIGKYLIKAKDTISGAYKTKDDTTVIAKEAFCDCVGLTSVELSNNVTGICESAFYGCEGLKSVTLGDAVEKIADDAFENCTGLTDITVSQNNKSYNSADGNLYNKDKTELILYALGKKESSFEIPDGVLSIRHNAFYRCGCLTSVKIPSSVKSIGNSAFDNCIGLTSVTIPDSVTSIGEWAFNSCRNLKSVKIGNGVTSIGEWAFNSCAALTLLEIGKGIKDIGDYAFYYCDKITDFYYGGTKSDFNKVLIGDGNDSITDAKMHFVTRVEIKNLPEPVMLDSFFTGGKIYTAYYDENGVLVRLNTFNVQETVTATPPDFYDCVIVMWWNGLDKIMPVCKSQTLYK